MRKAWRLLLIIVALPGAIRNDENTDCDEKHHFEGGFHSVIGEDNDKGDVENPDEENRKPLKMEGEEREPKQLQFSRLMERCVPFSS